MDLLLQLRGFVAVADRLSVSHAAEELGIDQPLLSRRLRALEDEFAVQLIDRRRRQIALTDAGTALLPRARALLDQADHLVAGIRAASSPTFRLTLPGSIEPDALARLVRLLEQHGVETTMTSEDDQDDADRPGWRIEPTTASAADWTVELGVSSPEPLRSAAVRLGDLRPRRGRRAREVLITEDDDHPAFVDAVRLVADRSGVSPRLIRCTTMPIARAALIAGQAVIITARRTAERDALSWVPLNEPELKRWFRLIERGPIPPALRQGELRDRVLTLLGIVLGVQQAGSEDDRWDRP